MPVRRDPLLRHWEVGSLYVCHSREWRKQSASAFGLSLQLPHVALVLQLGTPVLSSRATDGDCRLHCAFYPTCGSRVWHEGSATSETVMIKAGCLNELVDMSNAIHIWKALMVPGVVILSGAVQFSGEPNDSAMLM